MRSKLASFNGFAVIEAAPAMHNKPIAEPPFSQPPTHGCGVISFLIVSLPIVLLNNATPSSTIAPTPRRKAYCPQKQNREQSNMESCEFCKTTEKDRQLLLFDTGLWRVFLAENQSYFGRCIVILNRHCDSLSELALSEWDNLRIVVIKVEKLFKQTLEATMFNWTCLMNAAYQSDPPTPHLHLHCRPRFANPVDFKGFIYEDIDFAHHYDSQRTARLPEATVNDLIAMLKENIHAD